MWPGTGPSAKPPQSRRPSPSFPPIRRWTPPQKVPFASQRSSGSPGWSLGTFIAPSLMTPPEPRCSLRREASGRRHPRTGRVSVTSIDGWTIARFSLNVLSSQSVPSKKQPWAGRISTWSFQWRGATLRSFGPLAHRGSSGTGLRRLSGWMQLPRDHCWTTLRNTSQKIPWTWWSAASYQVRYILASDG